MSESSCASTRLDENMSKVMLGAKVKVSSSPSPIRSKSKVYRAALEFDCAVSTDEEGAPQEIEKAENTFFSEKQSE
jgi:hypothetical protein